MIEQLRLLDVPAAPRRLRSATIVLGKFWVAECRAVLAAAAEKSEETLVLSETVL